MKTATFAKALAIGLAISAAACSDSGSGDNPETGKPNVALPQKRAFVLNEGTFGMNNSTISFFSPDHKAIPVADIFEEQNSRLLGDSGRDIMRVGNDIYVAVSGSNYVARLDADCVEQTRRLFSTDPELQGGVRAIASDGHSVYASFYGGTVLRMDASTLDITGRLDTGGANLEEMAVAAGYLYVANSYEISANPSTGGSEYHYLDEVLTVRLSDFTMGTPVKVALNPNQLLEQDGKVFLISNGDYALQGYSLQMIDPARGNAVTHIAEATNMGAGSGKVYMCNSVTDWTTFQTTNTYRSYDIATATLSAESFIPEATMHQEVREGHVNFINTDPSTGDIYLGFTYYNLTTGSVWRYSAAGSYVETVSAVGYNPRGVVFVSGK